MTATLRVKEILLCHGSGIWLWLLIHLTQHTWKKVRSDHFNGQGLNLNKPTVYWVNWLRAKAQYDWWSEEHTLTPNEMNWTWLFFINKAKEWARLRDSVPDKPRHTCFAEGQISMWKELAFQATIFFINAGVMCEAIALLNLSWICLSSISIHHHVCKWTICEQGIWWFCRSVLQRKPSNCSTSLCPTGSDQTVYNQDGSALISIRIADQHWTVLISTEQFWAVLSSTQ